MKKIGQAFSALAVAILGSSSAWAAPPAWLVSETSGPVSIASPGVTRIAQRGGALAIGDIVSTGRGGRAVLVRGEEYLVVAPNTRITIADPGPSGGLTQVIEHAGNVIYKIRKMMMPHFAVQTPFLAAVVKGTTFSVTVTDKASSVQVIEGRVEVATRDGGASFLVMPGDIGTVTGAKPGQLRVEGRENRTIDSPAVKTVAPTSSSKEVSRTQVPADTPPSEIAAAVSEAPVSLAALTDGMVKGDSAMLTRPVVSDVPRQAELPPHPPAVVEPETVPATTPPTPLPTDVSILPPAPPAVVEPDTVPATTPPTPLPTAPPTDVSMLPPPPVVDHTAMLPPAPVVLGTDDLPQKTPPTPIEGNSGNGPPSKVPVMRPSQPAGKDSPPPPPAIQQPLPDKTANNLPPLDKSGSGNGIGNGNGGNGNNNGNSDGGNQGGSDDSGKLKKGKKFK